MATAQSETAESQRVFAQIRDVLAQLYPQDADARRVLTDAGLNEAWIEYNPRPVNFWHNILKAACEQTRVEALFRVVLGEFPTNPELPSVHAAYQELNDRGIPLYPGPSALNATPPPRELGGLQRAGHFVSRTAEREQLLTTLHPGALITLCGPGGMGKSALTAEVIHQLAPPELPPEYPTARFPHGIIVYTFYGEAHGSADSAFQHILNNLGAKLEGASPADATRHALTRKQLLLVLDGAEQADPAALTTVLAQRDPDHNAILITSRRRGDAPTGSTRIDLPPLPDDDATDLLQELAPSRVDDVTAARICQLVGYLPLAVTLVGDFLDSTGTAGQTYLQWLDETPLEALDWEQRRKRSVPLLLERSLAQVSPTARNILGVVGTLAYAPLDPDILVPALELTIGDRFGDRIQALGQLVDFGLLVHPEESPDAYTVAHALIHTYSREHLAPPDPTLDRLVTHVNDHVRANRDDNFPALDPLRPHVMALVATCHGRDRYADVLRLAWATENYLDLQGYWADRLELCAAAIQAAQTSEDRYDETVWLNTLGNAYRNLGQVEGAIDYYEQALTISRAIGDRRNEGAWLGNLGSAYAALGQVEGAIEYCEQALTISRAIGDRRGEGAHLGNLGNAYRNLGQVEGAIECYEQALTISREIGDRRNEGAWLGNLGIAYAALGQVEGAIEYYEQALTISRAIGDRRMEGNTLGNLGNAYAALGQVEGAIECYEQALTISRAIGDRRGEGAHLGNLGSAYAALGQVEGAIDYYEQALTISRAIDDRRGEGAHLGTLGSAYAALGQVEGAIEYYEQALTISRAIGDRRGEGAHLGNLGSAYAALGQVEGAIEYCEQALTISRAIGDRRGEGAHLGNLGSAYAALGQVEGAIECYEQALTISREIGDRRNEGAWLGNLGIAYAALGQVEGAIDYYEQALTISRKIGDRRGEGNHLANLGNAYKQQGDLERAKSCWQDALAIYTEIKSPTAERVRQWLAQLNDD